MINDIYKTRSCQACITAALNIYSNNFTKIFRTTWLWILMYSIVCGLLAFTGFFSAGNSRLAASLQGLAILIILSAAFILDIRITSSVVAMLNEENIKATGLKVLKIKLLEIGISLSIILCAISAIFGVTHIGVMQKLPMTTSIIVITATAIAVLAIAAIIFSPFIYSATKYVLESGMAFGNVFGISYRAGFRRLGFLFSLLVVITLIGFTLCLFLCIPACITFVACNVDNFGVASGDTSGLPSYFAWLNFISSSIMAFIMQYMAIWTMLTAFYAYGSVESLNKNITDKH